MVRGIRKRAPARVRRAWASGGASPRAERAAYGVAFQRPERPISFKIRRPHLHPTRHHALGGRVRPHVAERATDRRSIGRHGRSAQSHCSQSQCWSATETLQRAYRISRAPQALPPRGGLSRPSMHDGIDGRCACGPPSSQASSGVRPRAERAAYGMAYQLTLEPISFKIDSLRRIAARGPAARGNCITACCALSPR